MPCELVGRYWREYGISASNWDCNRQRNPDNEYDVAEIGDNVMIGCNAIILGRVKVGANAKIAAGSIVLRDVKANETVHGVVK